jgi:protein-S-isoprenylcysteine O-methyltransferase Ste14
MAPVVAWLGGAAFVASLGYFAYTYAVTLAVPAPDGANPLAAGAIDILLFFGFAAHHSVFARPAAKRWLRARIPARLERSTFVWMASLLLAAVCVLWQPLPGALYRHHAPLSALHAALVAAGIVLTALGAGILDPLELAGIAQVRRPRATSVSSPEPVTRFPYNVVRHPIYLGWVLMVFGVAHMTWSRFVMAVVSTAYLVVAVQWEERQLVQSFGPAYAAYRRRVRWRIVPFVY